MRLQSQRTRISATIPVAASLFVMAFAAPANAESGALIRKLAVTGTKLGIERPLGLAYRPDQDVFVIPDGPKMTLMSRRSVAGVVAERVPNPGAVAWDARHQRLLALEQDARSLVAIPAGENGGLDPAHRTRLSAPRSGLLRAVGMTVDPATGEIFVLDRLSRRVLRFMPTEGQTPEGQWIAIDTKAGGQLAGLVYDPATQHLFTIAVDARALVELAMDGREVGRRDLSEAKLYDPRGLVLASSSDQTDDPATRNFFVADAGQPADHGRVVELRAAPVAPRTTSLAPMNMAGAVAATGSPVLVQVISTAAWSPSSPDPSGIAYDSINNKLIIVDGEVEEMTIYAGKNAWETNLSGVVQRSWTTFGVFSPEPTGAAFNVDNKHLFVTDDDNRKIFEVNPGPDGLYGTSDDTRTSFSTLAFGSDDPEGCSYDHVNHKLFIADGISEEIYILTPGPNGVFDGVAPSGDDVMTHFDTTQYGVDDPETVEYKEDTGTLLLVSHSTKELVEVTETGAIISSTDISFAPLQNPAGAAYAPSSFDPTKKSLYIVNRGTDNDTDPTENDGTMVEIALTGGPPPDPNNYPVLSGADDAEESATGSISISSSDLELTYDGSNQTVGMRFSNINVPRGATITRAYVQFMTDEVNSEPTDLTIQGQAADNAAIFTFGAFGISSRPRTAASVSWSPVPWTTVGLSGPDQRTPELKSVIQEIVNRTGWISGNSLAIIIRGTGHRTARAYEYGTGTEVLHVEFASGTNAPPVVDAGPDRTVNIPASASLDGTVTDDGLPNPPAAVTVTWSVSSGPGTVTFGNAHAVDTQASFSQVGTYILRLTANDGALSASDTMTVTVLPPGNAPPLVDAGPSRNVVIPASAVLDGTVTDDGLPNPPAAVTVTWSVASGPGAVTFGNANAVDTQASFVQAGTYVLRLTANDGQYSASDTMTVIVRVNTAPVVDAGPNRTVVIGTGAVLDGTVTDDGLPSPPAAVTVNWSVSSGPGTVTFGNANAVDTQASFSLVGTYVLRLTATDSALSAFDSMTVTVQPPPNSPPVVDAGPNRAIVIPESALLDGTVTDDGQPIPPGAVTVTWTVASGPGGPVVFQNANAVDTQASFVQAGTYVLRLTASDGALSTSDSMTVIVRVNTAPVVDAGLNATVNILFGASLDGTVTDDGLPLPPAVTTTWSMSSGPGAVTFADANAVDTQASFSAAGTYVLMLTAGDGALSASDVTTITVQPAPPPGTSVVERRVAAASDDAEENLRNGSIHLSNSNLALGQKSKNEQGVGLRFTGLMVPRGIAITRAWVQFTSAGSQSVTTPLQVRGQAAGSPATFTAASKNVSSRPKTSASVAWSPAAWSGGQAGSAQRTPDITSLVQEIVNRGDWTPGNPMVILITGTGTRTASAFEGNAGAAAQLHIEY